MDLPELSCIRCGCRLDENKKCPACSQPDCATCSEKGWRQLWERMATWLARNLEWAGVSAAEWLDRARVATSGQHDHPIRLEMATVRSQNRELWYALHNAVEEIRDFAIGEYNDDTVTIEEYLPDGFPIPDPPPWEGHTPGVWECS